MADTRFKIQKLEPARKALCQDCSCGGSVLAKKEYVRVYGEKLAGAPVVSSAAK